jgi:hypothetical protein
MLNIMSMLFNTTGASPMTSGVSEANVAFDWPEPVRPDRSASMLSAARQQGLIGTKDRTIGGRVPSVLVEAAKARSGIQTDSELLLYALSKVALEDDFGPRLLDLKGSIPRDVTLDV